MIGHGAGIQSHPRGPGKGGGRGTRTGRYGRVKAKSLTIEAGLLTMKSAREGDTHRLTLLGEFDLAGAKAYEEEIERIEATDARRVLIDMSSLEFMDSTGLRLLLETDMRAREDSGRVQYVRPEGEVARLLELTRVDERLDFID